MVNSGPRAARGIIRPISQLARAGRCLSVSWRRYWPLSGLGSHRRSGAPRGAPARPATIRCWRRFWCLPRSRCCVALRDLHPVAALARRAGGARRPIAAHRDRRGDFQYRAGRDPHEGAAPSRRRRSASTCATCGLRSCRPILRSSRQSARRWIRTNACLSPSHPAIPPCR